jgi:hypothetical protein
MAEKIVTEAILEHIWTVMPLSSAAFFQAVISDHKDPMNSVHPCCGPCRRHLHLCLLCAQGLGRCPGHGVGEMDTQEILVCVDKWMNGRTDVGWHSTPGGLRISEQWRPVGREEKTSGSAETEAPGKGRRRQGGDWMLARGLRPDLAGLQRLLSAPPPLPSLGYVLPQVSSRGLVCPRVQEPWP